MKGKSFKRSILLVLLSVMLVFTMVMAGCAPRRLINKVTLNEEELEMTVGDEDVQLTATIEPRESVQTVKWSTSDKKVATVSTTGLVHAVGEGEVEITATSTEDKTKSATCYIWVNAGEGTPGGETVAVTGVTINKETLSLAVGGEETLEATVAPEDATNKEVTWTSSKKTVATVSATGKVTAIAVGTTTITVKSKEDATIKAKCVVTVTEAGETVAVTGVTLNKTETELEVGANETLEATIAPAGATNKAVTWTSSDTTVATVSASGKIVAKKAGTATVTVTTADGEFTATCEVTVTATGDTTPVTGLTVEPTSLTLDEGADELVVATVAPSNATNKHVDWTSSDTDVVTVDDEGNVHAVGAGTATLTATASDNDEITATVSVTVNAAEVKVTGITISGPAMVAPGSTITLTAEVAPATATNKEVVWTSTNEAVATVSATGVVTGVTNGTTTIKATAADGSNEFGTYQITVDVPVETVTLSATTLALGVNDTETLTATVAPANAVQTVIWSSSDTTIATVGAATGLVTAKKPGTVTITATSADPTKTATCTVTVSNVAVTSITVSAPDGNTTLVEGTPETLTAKVEPSNATNKAVTWSSNAPTVATVDAETGAVTYKSAGQVIITATAADGSNVTGSITLTVQNNPTKSRLVKGQALVTSGSSDPWYVPNGTTITFTKSGGGTETATVTNGNYSIKLTDGTWTASISSDSYMKSVGTIVVNGSSLNNKAVEFKYDLVEMNTALGGGSTNDRINIEGIKEDYIMTMLFKGNDSLSPQITTYLDKDGKEVREWTGFGLGVTGATWSLSSSKTGHPYLQLGSFNNDQTDGGMLWARPTDGGFVSGSTDWTAYETGIMVNDLKTTGIEVMMVVEDNFASWYVRKEGGSWFAAGDYKQKLDGTVTGFRILGNTTCGGNIYIADYSYTPIVTNTAGTSVTATLKATGGSSSEWNMVQDTKVYVQNGFGYSSQTVGANGALTMSLQDGTHKVVHPDYNGAQTITVASGAITETTSTLKYRIFRTAAATDTQLTYAARDYVYHAGLNLAHLNNYVLEFTVKADSSATSLAETNSGLGLKFTGLANSSKTYSTWQIGLIDIKTYNDSGVWDTSIDKFNETGSFQSRWCDIWKNSSPTPESGSWDLAKYKNEGVKTRMVVTNGVHQIWSLKGGVWTTNADTAISDTTADQPTGTAVRSVCFNPWTTEWATTPIRKKNKVYIADMKVIIGSYAGDVTF